VASEEPAAARETPESGPKDHGQGDEQCADGNSEDPGRGENGGDTDEEDQCRTCEDHERNEHRYCEGNLVAETEPFDAREVVTSSLEVALDARVLTAAASRGRYLRR
jgi:hypothetical protein